MAYTEDGFASRVVVGCRLRFYGWPADIPFINLSNILGGVRPLLQLRKLWLAGTLRFEPATDEDIANTLRDPRSVHPNPNPTLAAQRLVKRPAVVVFPAVLHPGTLASLGDHPTSTQPGNDTALGPRPRSQRIDVKKARRRPVTNPGNKPLRRAKPGVKSARYVLEEGGRHWAVNDPIEEFRSPALTRMRAAMRFGGGKVVGKAVF